MKEFSNRGLFMMNDWNSNKVAALLSILLFFLLFSIVVAHSSLMLDLERQYEAQAFWAESMEVESTDPFLSLVIMMESQSFEKDKVLKNAVRFLKGFNSSYDRVSLIFSDKQSVGFLPSQRYGVVLFDGKVQDLLAKELREDVKLVVAVSKARAASQQTIHDHVN